LRQPEGKSLARALSQVVQAFRPVIVQAFRPVRGDMKRSLIFAALVAAVGGIQAADRAEITFADARIFPESLTSTKNGDLYFGSLGQDSVYRAASTSTQATMWIKPKTNGLTTVLGVLA